MTSDDQAALLCRELAKRIEAEATYPGQVRVCVIREGRHRVLLTADGLGAVAILLGGATFVRGRHLNHQRGASVPGRAATRHWPA